MKNGAEIEYKATAWPTLWDNADLETGLHLLCCLESEKAIARLKNALNSPDDRQARASITAAMCRQPRIRQA